MAFDALKKKFPEEGSRCLKSCGKCCVAGAPLGKEEVNEIGDWLVANKSLEEITAQFHHFDDQPDRCPFLAPDKSCFIYPARPAVCVMFGHIPDHPDMPKKASQQCTEGVKFTQVKIEDTLPESMEWFEATGKAMTRVMNFRMAKFKGDEGGVEVDVDVPVKPGSKMERLTTATTCYWCGAPFNGPAYLENGELLCKSCDDNYEKGPPVHGAGALDGIPPAK
jgi:Fe-S-cluster containining protein